MKILIATILLGALGAGSYLYAKPAPALLAPIAAASCCAAPSCDATLSANAAPSCDATPSCDVALSGNATPLCDATLTCTPQGTCKIECQDANGATCSVEIACDGGTCHIVGCDGPGECKPSGQAECPPVCPAGCK